MFLTCHTTLRHLVVRRSLLVVWIGYGCCDVHLQFQFAETGFQVEILIVCAVVRIDLACVSSSFAVLSNPHRLYHLYRLLYPDVSPSEVEMEVEL